MSNDVTLSASGWFGLSGSIVGHGQLHAVRAFLRQPQKDALAGRPRRNHFPHLVQNQLPGRQVPQRAQDLSADQRFLIQVSAYEVVIRVGAYESRNDRFLLHINHPRLRPAQPQHLLIRSHRQKLAVPDRHRLGDAEILVHRQDFPVVQNRVGILDQLRRNLRSRRQHDPEDACQNGQCDSSHRTPPFLQPIQDVIPRREPTCGCRFPARDLFFCSPARLLLSFVHNLPVHHRHRHRDVYNLPFGHS